VSSGPTAGLAEVSGGRTTVVMEKRVAIAIPFSIPRVNPDLFEDTDLLSESCVAWSSKNWASGWLRCRCRGSNFVDRFVDELYTSIQHGATHQIQIRVESADRMF